MVKHVFYSYLLSIFIFWLGVCGYAIFNIVTQNYYEVEFGFIILGFVVSVILASPSFIIALVFIKPLIYSAYNPGEKLFLWIAAILFSAFLNALIPFAVFYKEITTINDLKMLIPAFLSITVSLLIRYKQFFKLNKSINNNENNLV